MADGPGRAGRGAKLGELPLAQLEELLSSAKTGRDEDEEDAEPSAARTPKPRTPKQRQGTRTKRPASPGSTARKKSSKMEDEEWIATQPHDVSNAGDEVVDGPFWEVYRLQTSKEEFFQSQECCTGFFCMSRVWNEGLGAQCSFPRRPGIDLCQMHNQQLKSQGYLTHGRVDGPIPPKKQNEFDAVAARIPVRTPKEKKECARKVTATGATGEPVPTELGVKFQPSVPSASAAVNPVEHDAGRMPGAARDQRAWGW
ncbi:TFIIS N-terminal domain-containing protein [Durusdinium trenchii]|uniref:TFIIS N-terminal domain-containing protein n=1 Tax=Durusdinium trenchii TaxID=1381693 RepID=A0ABP0NWQ4_9DINO